MNPLKMILGKRKQFFEIQDFPWCPSAVRDGVTDYLGFSLKLVPLYLPAVPWLKKMNAKNSRGWIDLCAGAGGGSIPLHEHLSETTLILTDLYPQQRQGKGKISYHPHSVDARSVSRELKGFRTLFTSFHHLPDEVAKSILKDAFQTKNPIGAFEFTERNLYCLLMTAPTIIFSFFLMPFVRPWRLSRFFWTYIIPLIPIVATFDILASCIRTRTPGELQEMVKELQGKGYKWHIGKEPSAFGFNVTYIVGMPEDE